MTEPGSFVQINPLSTALPHVTLHLSIEIDQLSSCPQILPIDECWLQDDAGNRALRIVTEWARANQAECPVYDTLTHDGFLRHLTIRKGRYDWSETKVLEAWFGRCLVSSCVR